MACPQSSGFPLHKAGSIGISWEFVRNAPAPPQTKRCRGGPSSLGFNKPSRYKLKFVNCCSFGLLM